VEFTDVFPTLCELAGLEVPEQLQGVSLVACLDSADSYPRKASTAIYKSGNALGYTVRTPRYRYIEWINKKTAEVEGRDLFDFKKDPLGKFNHANNPEYKDVVDEIAGYLHEDSNGWKLLERSLGK
jgi:iduronate 2-sulfatase